MSLWVFNCYISSGGRNVIEEWYDDLPPKAQAKFDQILEYLRDTPNTQWGNNYVKPLTNYTGIYEIRFSSNKIVYRPLGCFGVGQGVFTILMPAREHGDDWEPRNAPDIAEERKKEIFLNRERYCECNF